jgi:hypothetical protein
MPKTIQNLAIPLVIQEIENVLDSRHYHPYRQAYAIPELRQQLVTHVLNSAPACYAMVEETDGESELDVSLVPEVLRIQLRSIVVTRMQQVLEENSAWIDHHLPQETGAGFTPSSWFG